MRRAEKLAPGIVLPVGWGCPERTRYAGHLEARVEVTGGEKVVGDILNQATSDEQRLILQHYVEVIELRPTGTDGKSGSYALRLSSEVGPLVNPFGDKEIGEIGRNGKHGGTPVDAAVLTDPPLVRRVDEKAPRLGLEPRT